MSAAVPREAISRELPRCVTCGATGGVSLTRPRGARAGGDDRALFGDETSFVVRHPGRPLRINLYELSDASRDATVSCARPYACVHLWR